MCQGWYLLMPASQQEVRVTQMLVTLQASLPRKELTLLDQMTRASTPLYYTMPVYGRIWELRE